MFFLSEQHPRQRLDASLWRERDIAPQMQHPLLGVFVESSGRFLGLAE
jgi:hypothetical protein